MPQPPTANIVPIMLDVCTNFQAYLRGPQPKHLCLQTALTPLQADRVPEEVDWYS